jgi:hypothetical protein
VERLGDRNGRKAADQDALRASRSFGSGERRLAERPVEVRVRDAIVAPATGQVAPARFARAQSSAVEKQF